VRTHRHTAVPSVLPGTTGAALAATYDAVVIGAGIQGLALSYELARRGFGRIAVLDAAYPGSGASGRNGEMIRSAFASTEWIGLFDDSLRRWHALSAELDFNILFTPAGYLLLASTEDACRAFRGHVELQRRFGLRVRLLDAAEVRSLCPEIASEMVAGGIYQEDAGFAHHDAVVWAYAAAAARHGVEIHPYTAVTGIGLQGDAIASVTTGRGEISTRVVVDAAGGQAREIALMAGVDVPVEVFRLEAMVTEPLAPFLRPAVSSPAILGYCHQTTRGEFVGGTEPDAPQPSSSIKSTLDGARDMASKLVRLFPRLAGVRLMRQWSGLVTQTADIAPILGTAPGRAGFYLDCGWVYGFVGAPAAASLLADLMVTGSTPPTLAPFGFERLASGKLIRETSLVVAPAHGGER
jgi:heterotetrameric sarcosine oxidase beta subunit